MRNAPLTVVTLLVVHAEALRNIGALARTSLFAGVVAADEVTVLVGLATRRHRANLGEIALGVVLAFGVRNVDFGLARPPLIARVIAFGQKAILVGCAARGHETSLTELAVGVGITSLDTHVSTKLVGSATGIEVALRLVGNTLALAFVLFFTARSAGAELTGGAVRVRKALRRRGSRIVAGRLGLFKGTALLLGAVFVAAAGGHIGKHAFAWSLPAARVPDT